MYHEASSYPMSSARLWSEDEAAWLQDVIARDLVAEYVEATKVNISAAASAPYHVTLVRAGYTTARQSSNPLVPACPTVARTT